jgi:cytoskeletal protein CcmA (bactofilin family)
MGGNRKMDLNSDNKPDDSKLDAPDTVVEPQNSQSGGSTESLDSTEGASSVKPEDVKQRFVPKKGLGQRFQSLVDRFNVYFLLFLLILALAGIAIFVGYNNAKRATDTSFIGNQELSQEDLESLANSDQQIGDPQQTLTISSNAVFNGRVLVRDSLDVAGTIRVGGELSLPGITVSGTSAFENVQVASNLSIAGNTAVQGTLSVQQNLTVGGSASFSGQISAPALSVDRLILNEDLQINRHIDAGGPTPAVSRGGAVGGAGSVSISGTDTAGTVSINFGPGSGAGVIANVTFSRPFNEAPHVVITPIGSTCAGLNYYVNRTTGGFSINTTNATSGSCAFDYIAID